MASQVGQALQLNSLRVLVGGYINVNVIDGSAFFLSGVAAMFAGLPTVEVTLVTANPIRKWEVLDEVKYLPNVRIVDPYSDPTIQSQDWAPTGEYMTRERYASCLAFIDARQQFDAVLIRDNQTALRFCETLHGAASRLTCYVTGITSTSSGADSEVAMQLSVLSTYGVRFACQTLEIETIVRSVLSQNVSSNVFRLPPHVPDAGGSFEELYHYATNPHKLIYTGKFFKKWNADKILAAVKAARMDGVDIEIAVAGDQFHDDAEDDYFARNVRYLLSTSEGVTWYGRVPRRRSRQIIREGHVGVGWRDPSMDDSTELSTKVLEYGAMARPSIVNRTPMHEALLGADYPLFANSMEEFKALIGKLPTIPAEVEGAARKCFIASRDYWYSAVLEGFLDSIGNNVPSTPDFVTSLLSADGVRASVPDSLLDRKGRLTVYGKWADITLDDESDRTVADLLTDLDYRFSVHKRLTLEAWTAAASAGAETETPEGALGAISASAKASSEIRLRDERIRILTKELSSARERADRVLSHYEALRNSKLGSLQRKIWERKTRRGRNIR